MRMHRRTMLSQDVCPSALCLSVCLTPLLCRNGQTYQHFLHLQVATPFYLSTPKLMAIFRQDPQWGSNRGDMKKIAIFDRDLALYHHRHHRMKVYSAPVTYSGYRIGAVQK